MLVFRQDEKTFWKTMNPARLHALFDSYYDRADAIRPPGKYPQENPQPRSLRQYLMGGG